MFWFWLIFFDVGSKTIPARSGVITSKFRESKLRTQNQALQFEKKGILNMQTTVI